MSRINISVRSPITQSSRVRQLEGMFDVPRRTESVVSWSGEIDLDRPWSVGLIVGPSGSGKSTLLSHLFRSPSPLTWTDRAVIDDFDAALSMEQIAATCGSVGFNTIPAWMRPFGVLSGGEQFRAELARRLLEDADPIVVDEFTSVVDRQVAQIGAHAVQKWIRAQSGKRFVAASCHYDIVDWLQPDWTLEPATMALTWRSLQRRPPVDVVIQRCDYATWHLFAPYHYLTQELHVGARCFAAYVDGRPVSFAGMLYRPHAQVRGLMGVSRVVTLPDYQGLGLAMVLTETIAAAYKAIGHKVANYPAHPAYIRSLDRSRNWAMTQRPGTPSSKTQPQRRSNRADGSSNYIGSFGGRPNAVFRYVGPAEPDAREARRFIAGDVVAEISA